jgi:hypothetical protein
MSSYPEFPGAKGKDSTSFEAAQAIAPRVEGMRREVLEVFAAQGSLTVLEVVGFTRKPRESIQPRVSELRRMGLVESTGERRKNPSGQSAAVQRITAKGRAAL